MSQSVHLSLSLLGVAEPVLLATEQKAFLAEILVLLLALRLLLQAEAEVVGPHQVPQIKMVQTAVVAGVAFIKAP
jgi:hypothetical protein